MKTLTILIGNIGAGKSTYTKKAATEGKVIISKDAFRYMLGGGNYGYEQILEKYIHELTVNACKGAMLYGYSIVIDETNMCEVDRHEFLLCAKANGYNTTAIIFPRLSKEESVQHRLVNNHGEYTEEVWEEVWERKDKEYQEPTLKEFDVIRRVNESGHFIE